MQQVRLEHHGEVAVLTIANPPVNAIGAGVVAGLAAALASLEADRAYKALLVRCGCHNCAREPSLVKWLSTRDRRDQPALRR